MTLDAKGDVAKEATEAEGIEARQQVVGVAQLNEVIVLCWWGQGSGVHGLT